MAGQEFAEFQRGMAKAVRAAEAVAPTHPHQGTAIETQSFQRRGAMSAGKRDEDKPLADRRAEAEAPQDTDADFADEHTPSPTDPPNAEADTPGGEDEGYSPQTEVP